MKFSLFLIVFSTFLLFSNMALSNNLMLDDIKLSDRVWLEKCQKIRSKFNQKEYKKGIFTEFEHPLNNDMDVKFLNLYGLKFPLIRGVHDVPKISIGDEISINISRDNKVIVAIIINDIEYHDDIWAKIDRDSGEKVTSPEGVSYTHKIYGKPVSATQIEIDAFSYAPNNISCSQNKRLIDTRIILALEGKAFKPSTNNSFPQVSLFDHGKGKTLVEFEDHGNLYRLGFTSENNIKNYVVSYYFQKEQRQLMYDIAASFFYNNKNN